MPQPLEPLESRELFSATLGVGIYEAGRLLQDERYAVHADGNLTPPVRNALDDGFTDLRVVLDPGERYVLQPLDPSSGRTINDLYVSGQELTFDAAPEADADGSGGRASLSLVRSEEGKRWSAFYVSPDRGGDLTLQNVDLSSGDQRVGERVLFVNDRGGHGVTLENASIAPAIRPAGGGPQTRPDAGPGPDARPEAPAGPAELADGSPVGLYRDGVLLEDPRFEIQAGENILPTVREAMDAGHRELLVALDPGETYFLRPQQEPGKKRVNDLYLSGADLRVAAVSEVDADASGGRASLVMQRAADGRYWNPFFLNSGKTGSVRLEGLDLSTQDRRAGEAVAYVAHYGEGEVRVSNSSFEGPLYGQLRGTDAVSEPSTPAAPERPAPPTPRPPKADPSTPAAPDPVTPVAPDPVTPDRGSGGAGLYVNGKKLQGEDRAVRSGGNLLVTIRRAMDAGHRDLEVRLDPGETYDFTPISKNGRWVVNNLYLGGANLRIVSDARADADGSGGYANIEVSKSNHGVWATPFYLNDTGSGRLLLDGVSMTMPDRRPSDFVEFVVWRGGGSIEVVDSKLSGARNNLDISGKGGADVLIDRSIISYANAPDRDRWAGSDRKGGPSNGVYAHSYDSFTVRDSVFFHNGWRDDIIENSYGTIYSHGLYLNIGDQGPEATQITNTIFADNAANAAQLRAGGIVRDSFFLNSPFGVQLPHGGVYDSAFVQTNKVWPRGGDRAPVGNYTRYQDHGGFAIQVDLEPAKPDFVLGPVTVKGNTFADTSHPNRGRAPIHHEQDSRRPQKLIVSDNYELNWGEYRLGGPLKNYAGGGIERGLTGSTELDGAFGSRFLTIDQIVEASVNRDRGGYAADGLPEARDLVAFYRGRALAAAG